MTCQKLASGSLHTTETTCSVVRSRFTPTIVALSRSHYMRKMPKEEVISAESEILALLESHPDGVTNEELLQMTASIEGRVRGETVNTLLSSGKIEMLPGTKQGSFSLRIRRGTQIADASPEEQLIYSLIEESDKMGIWIREIRSRTGLSQAQVRKALKVLEQRKLVKSVKAIGTSKKCYMLYDVEADESLTGGAFYSDQQLDSQFVQTLVHLCVSMLQANSKRKLSEESHVGDPYAARECSFVRSSEVAQFVRDKGVCRVQLSVADIESILSVAVLDRSIERRADGMYRALGADTMRSASALLPCLQCPLAADCFPGAEIAPQTCEYFAQWLANS
ncbi:putative DNA-directed RNA polymerase III subunit RPC6 [Toxocara canis]|uniref:DNA-directed RNA polymerase III subunit RPC6 n=1 Tax=Toxocara canis TaxID=6265 RepID=A0A0B2UP61_TOXCA|nr:putative DNA-directed RNA polymerase III subunit RPC6 [Toxocara canis]